MNLHEQDEFEEMRVQLEKITRERDEALAALKRAEDNIQYWSAIYRKTSDYKRDLLHDPNSTNGPPDC